QEADFLPQVGLVLPAHNADRALELLAIDPEFAVQRFCGQAGAEPVRSVQGVAQPGNEAGPCPVRSHAVELLRHQVAREVSNTVPTLGEQEGRSLDLRPVFPGPDRHGAADALFLSLITSQLADML